MNKLEVFPKEGMLKAFETVPDLYLILSPDLVILTASNAYLEATLTQRSNIAGKYLFHVFPENAVSTDIDAGDDLFISLQEVLKTKKPHQMPPHRYDLFTPEYELVERYWQLTNNPVLDERGNILYIIQRVEDITELVWEKQHSEKIAREAEAELKKQERKAAEVLNIVNGAFIEIDAEYRYRYVNKKAQQILGKNLNELLGKIYWEEFPGAIGTEGYNAIVKANTEKVKVELEYYSAVYSRWVFMSVTPSEQGVIIFQFDRQDIKEAEENLLQEHRRLKEAEAIGNVGSFEWRAAANKIYWSDEMYRIHGLEPQSEEITLERVLSFIPEEEKNARSIVRLRKEPGEIQITHRLIRADGAERFVRRKLKSFAGEDGTITHLTGTIQDITEQVFAHQKLEESEALLRAAERAANTGSYEVDLVQDKIYFSDGLFHLFGEQPENFIPTLEWIDSHSDPADAGVIRKILEQAAEDKKPYTYTRHIYRSDGEERILEAHGNVICDADGKVCKFIGLVQDVTERKKAEQELFQLKNESTQ